VLIVATEATAASFACNGRFVVTRASGSLVQGPGDVVVLDGTSAVVDPACGAATARVQLHRRLKARWNACRGRRVLRLALRASADCSLLHGSVAAPGVRTSRFVAVASRCGDGIVDAGTGERCDDGNASSGDGCDPTCGKCVDPATLATTWDAIQANVFDRCVACHGSSAAAGLDLRPTGSYERIVGVPAAGGLFEVAPGMREQSLVWRKLAKATFGGRDDVGGAGMPFGAPLPADVVEAFGRWIDAGAPRDGLVAGAEALFVPCD